MDKLFRILYKYSIQNKETKNWAYLTQKIIKNGKF